MGIQYLCCHCNSVLNWLVTTRFGSSHSRSILRNHYSKAEFIAYRNKKNGHWEPLFRKNEANPYQLERWWRYNLLILREFQWEPDEIRRPDLGDFRKPLCIVVSSLKPPLILKNQMLFNNLIEMTNMELNVLWRDCW